MDMQIIMLTVQCNIHTYKQTYVPVLGLADLPVCESEKVKN